MLTLISLVLKYVSFNKISFFRIYQKIVEKHSRIPMVTKPGRVRLDPEFSVITLTLWTNKKCTYKRNTLRFGFNAHAFSVCCV